jgi:hypothetical protein
MVSWEYSLYARLPFCHADTAYEASAGCCLQGTSGCSDFMYCIDLLVGAQCTRGINFALDAILLSQ